MGQIFNNLVNISIDIFVNFSEKMNDGCITINSETTAVAANAPLIKQYVVNERITLCSNLLALVFSFVSPYDTNIYLVCKNWKNTLVTRTVVRIKNSSNDDNQLEQILNNIQKTRLLQLDLCLTNVTDASMQFLAGLTNLQQLNPISFAYFASLSSLRSQLLKSSRLYCS